MKVEAIQVPAVHHSRRIGWAECEAVPSKPVPSFMVWPDKESTNHGQGLTLAQPGEKLIIYLLGGGYVSGHPLRTHLVWTISKWLNTRIFGE
jgi:hypothetical protein